MRLVVAQPLSNVSSRMTNSQYVSQRYLSLGVSETVKFVARHTMLCDLLRIFNLVSALTHLRSEKAEKRIL